MTWQHISPIVVGIFVGFLGGLFGKGGSAVATPLLSLLGFPGFVAVVAPLPATVPGTLIASFEYWESHLLDWEIFWWSVGVGVPATVIGALLSQFTGAGPLLLITALLVVGFGISFLIWPSGKHVIETDPGRPPGRLLPSHRTFRLVAVAAGVGLFSGLLANSGGFLLAPSYARFLDLPIKKAFACSLAVSTVLAIPGTIVHAYLGHVDWPVAGLIALGSVPASYAGARVAIHTRSGKLERLYGLILTALGIFFLVYGKR